MAKLILDETITKEQMAVLLESYKKEVVTLNSVHSLINQFTKNADDYFDEISYSPVFYDTVFTSLNHTMIIMLHTFYDNSCESVSMLSLLTISDNNVEYFGEHLPEYKRVVSHTANNSKELQYFSRKDNCQRILDTSIYHEEDKEVSDSLVYLTFEQYIKYLIKFRYNGLSSSLKLLRDFRNKYYAHTSYERIVKATIDDQREYMKQFDELHCELDKLVQFINDAFQLLYGGLTGIQPALAPVNILDWEGSLRLLRLGAQYQQSDQYISDLMNEVNDDA